MSYLIGVMFAYQLSILAQKFGANVFVVDGVGLAITRELAPLITAVLVAGRSGAAFIAHLSAGIRLGHRTYRLPQRLYGAARRTQRGA